VTDVAESTVPGVGEIIVAASEEEQALKIRRDSKRRAVRAGNVRRALREVCSDTKKLGDIMGPPLKQEINGHREPEPKTAFTRHRYGGCQLW